jgi:hypothetical protein
MHYLTPLLEDSYRPLSVETGKRYAEFFRANRYVILPNFFSDWGFSIVRGEGQRLAGLASRRDVFMDESHSWRHMATIGSLKLQQLSSIVPDMYRCNDLFEFLSGVAGEPVDCVPDKNEQYVLNCLQQGGDYHGGHVDSYSFAFNVIIDTPPPGSGGVVKILESLDSDPFDENSIQIPLRANDAYFLRTDIAVHMVTQVAGESRRIALNFAYKAGRDDAQESYSSAQLYA